MRSAPATDAARSKSCIFCGWPPEAFNSQAVSQPILRLADALGIRGFQFVAFQDRRVDGECDHISVSAYTVECVHAKTSSSIREPFIIKFHFPDCARANSLPPSS